MSVDLFGNERPGARTDAEKKREHRRMSSQARGWYMKPGTGPAGETCKTCKHSYYHETYRKRFWKCDRVKPTHGPETDIRVSWAACGGWEAGP